MKNIPSSANKYNWKLGRDTEKPRTVWCDV